MKQVAVLALAALATILSSAPWAGAAEPPTPFSVETVDAVTIRGRLYDRGGDIALIYCHSLLRSQERLDARRLLDVLAPSYDVITFDFRGHRTSFGRSSVAGDEILDLRAVMGFARRAGYDRIAVLGAGMGATTALRTASIFGNIDALVAVSPFGMTPDLTPWLARRLRYLLFDTTFGEFSIRLFANTRVGSGTHAGYPVDLAWSRAAPPSLVIQSTGDRQVKLDALTELFEQRFPVAELRLVPGRKRGEQLLDDGTLAAIRDFLDAALPPGDGGVGARANPDGRADIGGDLVIPEEIARAELDARLSVTHGRRNRARGLEDVLAYRGYTLAAVNTFDSTGPLTVAAPRIHDVALSGNRRVSEAYLRSVLALDGGYFNAYELDKAARRVASDPAVNTVRESVVRRADGDVSVRLRVRETFPASFFAGAKFTDIDQFFGGGMKWNEFNPSGWQFDGVALYGREGGRFLSEVRLGHYTFAGTLFLSVAHYNMIRSRDELEFVFPRQEAHNIGAEASARYRASDNVSLEVRGFGQRDREPESDPELPVREGRTAGAVVRLDVGGRLPLQGPPLLEWRHTFYYKRAGLFDAGDFDFETYQWNLIAKIPITPHFHTRTSAHAGHVTGGAPPQELMSLGGMHTFPGYDDDAFVNGRMAVASLGLYLSARQFVDDTSRWAPLRLIVSGHAGTVWGRGVDFDTRLIASDMMMEVDYFERARIGVVFPTGSLRSANDPRVFIGWTEHVEW